MKIRVKASPVGRRKPGGALYKNHVLIYGGYNGDYLSDLLCLNLVILLPQKTHGNDTK